MLKLSPLRPPIRLLALLFEGIMGLLARRDYRGVSKLPAEGGYIIVANHLCSFDAVTMLNLTLRNGISPRIAARDTLFSVPILGSVMRYMKHIPVSRGAGRAEQVLAEFVNAIEDQGVLVIYPEGTTTNQRDYWPMTFKTGAAKVALQTGCRIYPIAQWGNQYILPRYSYVLRFWARPRVEVQVLDPVDCSDLDAASSDSVAELTERIRSSIYQGVAEIREEDPPRKVHDMRVEGNPWNEVAHSILRQKDRSIISRLRRKDRQRQCRKCRSNQKKESK